SKADREERRYHARGSREGRTCRVKTQTPGGHRVNAKTEFNLEPTVTTQPSKVNIVLIAPHFRLLEPSMNAKPSRLLVPTGRNGAWPRASRLVTKASPEDRFRSTSIMVGSNASGAEPRAT